MTGDALALVNKQWRNEYLKEKQVLSSEWQCNSLIYQKIFIYITLFVMIGTKNRLPFSIPIQSHPVEHPSTERLDYIFCWWQSFWLNTFLDDTTICMYVRILISASETSWFFPPRNWYQLIDTQRLESVKLFARLN